MNTKIITWVSLAGHRKNLQESCWQSEWFDCLFSSVEQQAILWLYWKTAAVFTQKLFSWGPGSSKQLLAALWHSGESNLFLEKCLYIKGQIYLCVQIGSSPLPFGFWFLFSFNSPI